MLSFTTVRSVDDLREYLAALRIRGALFSLDRAPFRMTGHAVLSPCFARPLSPEHGKITRAFLISQDGGFAKRKSSGPKKTPPIA